MARAYKIGTRGSPLALRQAEEVLSTLRKHHPSIQAEIICIDTYGDKDKITPIAQIEGTDFFTREIDEVLLNGQIDFAVHSAKDLPDVLREGLTVAAITESIDPDDVLVSRYGLSLNELPYGAAIGTSSLRRKQGLKRYRSDFNIVDIRGNIKERLERLYSGDLDAIAIAAAGLLRLGLKDSITQRITSKIIEPHPLQGALAVVTKEKDLKRLAFLSVIDSGKRGLL